MQILKRFLLLAGWVALSCNSWAQIVSFPLLDNQRSETDAQQTTATALDSQQAAATPGDTIIVRDVTQELEESFGQTSVAGAGATLGSGLTVGHVADAALGEAPVVLRFGYCNRQALIEAQPEYAVAMAQLDALRKQYEAEVTHNETDFRRQFTEYLYGQKEFPQAILLKRQRDLQAAMEQGLAFRAEADSLLAKAEGDLVQPIGARIDAAISRVAAERGYAYVVDTGSGAYLYLHPRLSEDITEYVIEALQE